jgi:glycosyltransferase involved in cell wall biosynthesis
MGAWSQVVSYTQFGARELTAAVQDGFDVFAENIKDRVDPTAPAGWVGVPIGNRRSLHVRLDRLARLQNLDAWNIIPHGREPNMFGPRDKMECRQQFGLPDGFLIGVVGGNQVRKRLDTAIRIFAEFARTHPDAYLVLHCWGGDDAGWDIAALARFYGVVDRIFPVHWQHSELSDDQLCSLYNCFDVMLNTSSGEGWGLTATESAECGVLQMVPDWAATGEIWRDNGALLIPPLDYLHFEKYLNTAHCVLNIPAAVALLNQCYADPNMRARQIELSQKRVADIPTWDAVADAFEIILNRAIDEGPPVPTSVNDVLASRKKTVRSQILDPIPV